MSKPSWRLVALALVGLGGLAIGARMLCSPARAIRRTVLTDARATAALPLNTRLGAGQGLGGRWLGLDRRSGGTVTDAEAWLERQFGGPRLETLTLDTQRLGAAGAVPLEGLLITPPGAPPTVLLYLASSGVSQGPGLDAEALAIFRRFDPPRRILVLPLPCAQQRGPGWPSLATVDAVVLERMLRQTTLDLARADYACRGAGWRVEALGGFSLGGCFAAAASGLRPDLWANVDLFLWGAGGDLETLVNTSTHGLAGQLRPAPGSSHRAWRRRLTQLDPLTHAARSRLAQAVLVGGRTDSVMPPACVAALAAELRRSGAQVRVDWVDGGHLATIGAPPALTRWFAW